MICDDRKKKTKQKKNSRKTAMLDWRMISTETVVLFGFVQIVGDKEKKGWLHIYRKGKK